MKYPYKTQLEMIAWLIFEFVPMDKLPDEIHEAYRATDAGDSNGCLDAIHGYLIESAVEYIDSIPPMVIPDYDGG